ncbi:MAG TPA: uroporphyrinogen-III synthase [Gemmatimonas sp.]|nr:uroporphyrinogen-III synthase [Gemmatimonas sp.]
MTGTAGEIPAGRSLAGVRIAVTRAGDRGSPLAAQLRAVGATVHEVPLTRIETLPGDALAAAVRELHRYQWILLTSVNAVEHLDRALTTAAHRDILRMRKVAVVGPATAAAAETRGWTPTLVPERFLADALVDAMAVRDDVDGARMLYPAAEGARDVLPAGLTALGAVVDVVPVYRSAPDPDGCARIRALALAGELDLVTVAAPSAVDALLDALPAEHARRLPVACIGPVTAKAARAAGFPVRVESGAPTVEGLVREIVRAVGVG